MSETGVVKFRCEHVRRALEPFDGFDELQRCRTRLRDLGVLGVGSDGVGFGNVSVRAGRTAQFYITGSGSGGLETLRLRDIALVTDFNFDRNSVRCAGDIIASAESLTHAAAYRTNPAIGAVIHGHSAALWCELRDDAPTTSAATEYGTPEMARELMKLIDNRKSCDGALVIMGGHRDGFIAFGADLTSALATVQRALRRKSA